MNFVLPVLVFVFGLGIGSFLNVLVDRRERGEQATRGRSYCESCKKILTWYELVPVVSFVLQKRKCRSCKSVLSYQYPTIELLTGAIFVLVFLEILTWELNSQVDGTTFLAIAFAFLVASLLLAILIYDFRHKIIPNEFVYPFAVLALLGLLVHAFIASQVIFSINFLLALLAGPILATPFALLWLFSHGTWMGLGDAKLALGIGWLLGLAEGFTAIVIAFWIGAAIALAMMFVSRIQIWGKLLWFENTNRLTMKSELPLGPFLILGTALVFFFGINFFDGSFLFSFNFFS